MARRYLPLIDPGQYDRSPALSKQEQEALEDWTPRHGLKEHVTRRMPRLCTPLLDVVEVFCKARRDGANIREKRSAVRSSACCVLAEMKRSRESYWTWPSERWLTLINSSRPRTRLHLAGIAYLLCTFDAVHRIEHKVSVGVLARSLFGGEFDRSLGRLLEALQRIGYASDTLEVKIKAPLGAVALTNRSVCLERIDERVLWQTYKTFARQGRSMSMISHGLVALGVLGAPLRMREYPSFKEKDYTGIAPEWVAWCRRWRDTSTLMPQTRENNYSYVLRVGLWLAKEHPEITGPAHWTVETCADFLAAVCRLKVGEWTLRSAPRRADPNEGKPLRANSRRVLFYAVRRFFRDVEEWGWATLRFNPMYHLATPKAVSRLTGPNPRDIDEKMWLRIVHASLHLTAEDLLGDIWYPLEMLQAVAVVWTHSGLRQNEIARLRLECARPQTEDLPGEEGEEAVPAGALCYLSVPASLKAGAYVKPVQDVVRQHVEAWEALRPDQPQLVDRKTGEHVRFLFQYRGRKMGASVIGNTIIPMLCRKAGVPQEDARGPITSHRARASTATMLINASNGMSLPQLQKWLGHDSPKSTMHYYRVRPAKLARAFAKADETAHMIEVIIDHDVVLRGAADEEPWKLYPLSDGRYCSNPFWSTCPHRMACAGCDFYVPVDSAYGATLAAKASLHRFLEAVPLTNEERAAAEGDIGKLDRLAERLRDVPTPDGRTPRQIETGTEGTDAMISLKVLPTS